MNVRVDGQLVFNNSALMLNAAIAGLGLVMLTHGQIEPYLQSGELIGVLEDWCEPFPVYHLYYPSRRQPTPAFTLLLEAFRYRG